MILLIFFNNWNISFPEYHLNSIMILLISVVQPEAGILFNLFKFHYDSINFV